ncbi:PorT family protein [Flavobacteriales bacterium]|nr:PorT family protein [Crocinitomicaceae bacterium]MDA7743043.1 PorT family protein [Flavobacteriales bacterium]
MNKLISFFSIVCFLLPSKQTIQAQDDPLKFAARVNGGLSTTQVHGDQISGFNKFGYTAGASVDIRRKASSGVQFGMFLTQKGSRRVPDPKNGDYTTWSYRFTYIDLPIIKTWDAQDWWIGAGIQPSILVRGEEDFYGNGFTELSYLELLPVDLGAVAAAGWKFNSLISTEVRLSQSLMPISERPDQPVQRWNNFMMNMAIQWMITLSVG